MQLLWNYIMVYQYVYVKPDSKKYIIVLIDVYISQYTDRHIHFTVYTDRHIHFTLLTDRHIHIVDVYTLHVYRFVFHF